MVHISFSLEGKVKKMEVKVSGWDSKVKIHLAQNTGFLLATLDLFLELIRIILTRWLSSETYAFV